MRAWPALLACGLVLLTALPAHAALGGVRVALLDSGILASHSEFTPGQVVAWRDFVNGGGAPYDDHGHGTAVASRAAGRTLGAFPGVELVVGKVLSGANFATWANVAAGIRWAAGEGADVISVSIWSCFPQPTNVPAVAAAIHDATEAGSLVVWIAGNGGAVGSFCQGLPSVVLSTPLVGSSSPEALVVGASTSSGLPAGFSQKDPEVLAGGVAVRLAWNDGSVVTGSGTSFAAPWVAGVAARLRDDGAPRDPGWLKWVILHSATDRVDVTYLDEGYGNLDAGATARARAVAQGAAPVPAPDARDATHLATAAARVALTQQMPAGALPP